MSLEENIAKQIEAGFTYEEILQNLSKENHNPQDILNAYNKMKAEVPQGGGNSISIKTVLSYIVTAIIIIRLIYRLANL